MNKQKIISNNKYIFIIKEKKMVFEVIGFNDFINLISKSECMNSYIKIENVKKKFHFFIFFVMYGCMILIYYMKI